MKTNRIFLVMTATALSVCGCNKSNDSTYGENNGGTSAEDGLIAGIGRPSDYFPTTVGKSWTYEIKVPDIEDLPPLVHRVIRWPLQDGKHVAVQEMRGRLLPRQVPSDGHVRLIVSVARAAVEQGDLQSPEGYELKIERDDLGMFEEGSKLYWAITRTRRYQVTEVTTFDPAKSVSAPGGEWGSYGQKYGQAMRVSFFGSKPGIAIGISEQNDTTAFIGIEKFGDSDSLHFQRIVDASTPDRQEHGGDPAGAFLDSGFREDMWFVRGVGLARLVQRVDGHVTMTWQLVGQKGSPPPEPAELPAPPPKRRNGTSVQL